MKSVKPEELISHRVFFTEFDRYNTIFLWENNKSDIERLIERKLKLLISMGQGINLRLQAEKSLANSSLGWILEL